MSGWQRPTAIILSEGRLLSSNIGELNRSAVTTQRNFGGIWREDTNLPSWRLLCTPVDAECGWRIVGARQRGACERTHSRRSTSKRPVRAGWHAAWHAGNMAPPSCPQPESRGCLSGIVDSAAAWQPVDRPAVVPGQPARRQGGGSVPSGRRQRVGGHAVFDRVGVGRRNRAPWTMWWRRAHSAAAGTAGREGTPRVAAPAGR